MFGWITRLSWRDWPVVLLLVVTGTQANAQSPTTTWQVHALGTSATSQFIGAGVGFARRVGGRLTYQLSLTPGVAQRAFAVRSEGMLVFSLDPARRGGISPYGGGGMAVLLAKRATDVFLVLVVGLESAPRTRSGWFAELGLGGGVRVSVGWRIRA